MNEVIVSGDLFFVCHENLCFFQPDPESDATNYGGLKTASGKDDSVPLGKLLNNFVW